MGAPIRCRLGAFGFFLPGRYEQPIYGWHKYRGPEVNWWYFVLPPAIALAVRLVVRGFSSKPVPDELPPQQPLVPSAGTQISEVAATVTPRRRRRWLKWTVAAVFLVVWSAFVFGLGIEMHEKQMFAAQYQPGSVSYRLGSTAYTFGDDGFKRGYSLGAARAQAGVKAVKKQEAQTTPAPKQDAAFDYSAIARELVEEEQVLDDYESPPEWGSALAAHQAQHPVTGQDAAFARKRYLDSLVSSFRDAAPAAPKPTPSR